GHDLRAPSFGGELLGAGRGMSDYEPRVVHAHGKRAREEGLSGQAPGESQDLVDAGPVHGEEQGVGIGRLGRRAEARFGTGLTGEPSELALAPRVAEDDLVTGAREDRAELTAHESRSQDSNSHAAASPRPESGSRESEKRRQ